MKFDKYIDLFVYLSKRSMETSEENSEIIHTSARDAAYSDGLSDAYKEAANKLSEVINVSGWRPVSELDHCSWVYLGRWGGGCNPPIWQCEEGRGIETNEGKLFLYRNFPMKKFIFYDQKGEYADPTHFFDPQIPQPPKMEGNK